MISPETAALIFDLDRKGARQNTISKLLKVSQATIYRLLSDFTRVVVLSDLHCGNRAGLTHPDWQWHHDSKFSEQQKEMWDWYAQCIENLLPVDILLILGDCVDGVGKKSGGTEQITTDRKKQADMAVAAISPWHAPRINMVYGTPYHTGCNEDWEDIVADKLGVNARVDISGHEFININGIRFDCKHSIGSSSIPHGRHTAIARSKLWNDAWHANHEKQPSSQILLRGHVHYMKGCLDPNWIGTTCPSLQGWGSKFGVRKCEGLVDTGLMWFDIPKKATCIQDVKWSWDIPNLETQRVEVRQY